MALNNIFVESDLLDSGWLEGARIEVYTCKCNTMNNRDKVTVHGGGVL